MNRARSDGFWSDCLFLFFLFLSFLLGSGGELCCRLGNGAKAELLLFNLAAALAVCTFRSAADRVSQPAKTLFFLNFSVSTSQSLKYFRFTLSASVCFYLISTHYPLCHLSSHLFPQMFSSSFTFSFFDFSFLSITHSLSVSCFNSVQISISSSTDSQSLLWCLLSSFTSSFNFHLLLPFSTFSPLSHHFIPPSINSHKITSLSLLFSFLFQYAIAPLSTHRIFSWKSWAFFKISGTLPPLSTRGTHRVQL